MLMAGRKMKTEKILCEVCDNHCELEVEVEDEEVQDVSGKVKEPVKKTTTRKASEKPAAEKTEEVKAETVKKETVKKAKAAPEVEAAVHFEFSGKSYTPEDLVKICKDVWKYDLNGKEEELGSVELYVKPEENVTYYVINGDIKGSFNI